MELFPAIRYIFFLQKKDTATIGARANTFDTSLARIAAKILLQIVMKRSAMAFCKRLQRIAGIAPNKKATQILRGFYYNAQYSILNTHPTSFASFYAPPEITHYLKSVGSLANWDASPKPLAHLLPDVCNLRDHDRHRT